MAKDLNKVMLIGRLGQDPELKYTQNGTAVVSFSLATNARWKDQNDEWKDKTEWHNIKAWRGLAETCSNYLKKGSKIYLEGRLEYSDWEDENKKKHYRTEIVIDNMIMLDSKAEGKANNKIDEETSSGTQNDDDLPF
jgi:single-strand DNA-binding protein